MRVTMASSFHRNAASDDPVMELLKLFGLKHDPAPQRLAPPQTVLERDFQWDSHGPAPNDDCSTHAQMGRPEGAQGPGNVLDQLAGLPCFHPFAHHGGDYFHDGGRLARKTRRHILPPNEFLWLRPTTASPQEGSRESAWTAARRARGRRLAATDRASCGALHAELRRPAAGRRASTSFRSPAATHWLPRQWYRRQHGRCSWNLPDRFHARAAQVSAP